MRGHRERKERELTRPSRRGLGAHRAHGVSNDTALREVERDTGAGAGSGLLSTMCGLVPECCARIWIYHRGGADSALESRHSRDLQPSCTDCCSALPYPTQNRVIQMIRLTRTSGERAFSPFRDFDTSRSEISCSSVWRRSSLDDAGSDANGSARTCCVFPRTIFHKAGHAAFYGQELSP